MVKVLYVILCVFKGATKWGQLAFSLWLMNMYYNYNIISLP